MRPGTYDITINRYDKTPKFFNDLIEYHKSGKNGFWPVILKNSFAPLFSKSKFDVLVGNPPWISWKKMFLEFSLIYSFFSKSFSEKTAYISILVGLLGGILLFPSPDFSKSILVGILFPASYFPEFVTQSLLFLSFIAATLLPVLTWKVK